MAEKNFGKIIQYIRSWQAHLWLKWSCVTRTTLAIFNNLDDHNNRNKLPPCWHDQITNISSLSLQICCTMLSLITVSKILLGMLKREIGRQLPESVSSSFLKIGVSLAVFHVENTNLELME